MNKKWRPQWAVENRDPRFGTADITNLGGSKVLWGKIPAFDCLKLEGNEGHQWGQDLYLLFACEHDPLLWCP